MPLNKDIKKVLVIGSGPIVIGQAAEFDYAGAQACRVLKDAGLDVVLVNSNPATIMTDKALADEIYLEPLNAETIKRIIEKERPDSLLAGLGGQTGLTIAMQLNKEGYLDKMGVKLIGTNADAIDKAEDRQLFRDTMVKIGQPCIPSDITTNMEGARKIAAEIGYPVIIRPAFTLGGAGGGVCYTPEDLEVIAHTGLTMSPISQILVEKYIYGWKEIEFETMRDSAGNCIAICSMENVDPVGVHTGDSIVVAPAVTLSSYEYDMLRKASLDIITELGIEGGCNCQFALNPESFEYAVIEVNPRVSRSSALASKATGYPIAKVTSKIALGYTLDEIQNDITKKTCACFEPTVDYLVVKFPKWPFDKFVNSSRTLGTQMKATGEVMSIGTSFEMAIMKAVRGAEISMDTLNTKRLDDVTDIEAKLHDMDDMRMFTIFKALKNGFSVDKIHEITRIDEWFLYKLKNLADYELMLESGELTDDYYEKGKKLGYTDAAIERISGVNVMESKKAVYKMVDTCAAEFKAETPYFYSTFDNHCESRAFKRSGKDVIMVLGSGPIRIGQGIEFDYSSVHCVWSLKELGYEVVIINNNPETVSTDFDTADRLYFEPLTEEDVMNVIDVEKPIGVVVAFGGQTAIKLTKFLDEQGIQILGTSAEGIDIAEDREKFDALLEKFGIRRPQGRTIMNTDDALKAAEELEYPVLLRPSYVIGGQNMQICYTPDDIRQYMQIILEQKIENPVLVDKYMMGAELEVDVISDGKDVLIPGVMQHIERAGVHSGDSIAVYPPYNLNDKMLETLIDYSEKLTLELGTKGLVNIQYLIYRNELYVIEVNPRASRTIPYISKVTGVPMVELATKIMVGQSLKSLGYGTGLYKTPPYFAVKAPVFSFEKLSDVNSSLGPEMKSTGEVLGLGENLEEALYKALTSAGFRLHDYSKKSGGVLLSVSDNDKPEVQELARKFNDFGVKIYATKSTAELIEQLGIKVHVVKKLHDDDNDEVMQLLEDGKLDYIIYTGVGKKNTIEDYIRINRRAIQLSVTCITSMDTANALVDTIASRYNLYNTELVDINNMRLEKEPLDFYKMQGCGNDFIILNNFKNDISCPESLTISLVDRNYGIGANGLVLVERSSKADAKMRVFGSNGKESDLYGNCIHCVAKYLYDRGMIKKSSFTIETSQDVRKVKVHILNDEVRSVTVNMGKPDWDPATIPAENSDVIKDFAITCAGKDLRINSFSLNSPHCVVFCDNVDVFDLEKVGYALDNNELFPKGVNTELVQFVNKRELKLRVWKADYGLTLSSGTGACAAVAAAVENGLCNKNEDITVKTKGGELIVNYTDDGILLSGNVSMIFNGTIKY